jgi:hypothetical protein
MSPTAPQKASQLRCPAFHPVWFRLTGGNIGEQRARSPGLSGWNEEHAAENCGCIASYEYLRPPVGQETSAKTQTVYAAEVQPPSPPHTAI